MTKCCVQSCTRNYGTSVKKCFLHFLIFHVLSFYDNAVPGLLEYSFLSENEWYTSKTRCYGGHIYDGQDVLE